jgi:hypothetical protein
MRWILGICAVAALVVGAWAATGAPGARPAGSVLVAASQTAQSLEVTPKVRRELRRALVRSGEPARLVDGPLWGRRCIPSAAEGGETCKRYTVEYSLYEETRWALAYFLIEQQEEEVVFLRRAGRRWDAQRGFGSQEPIPCPVLRDWGEPC